MTGDLLASIGGTSVAVFLIKLLIDFIRDLRKDSKAKDVIIKTITNEFNAEIAEHQKTQSKFNQIVGRIELMEAQYKSTLDTYKKDLLTANRDNELYVQQLGDVYKQIGQLKQQIDTQAKSHNRQMNGLRQQFNQKYQKKVNELARQTTIVEKQAIDLQELESVKAENVLLTKERDELSKRVDSLRQEVDALHIQVNDLMKRDTDKLILPSDLKDDIPD